MNLTEPDRAGEIFFQIIYLTHDLHPVRGKVQKEGGMEFFEIILKTGNIPLRKVQVQ
jgi:hypothetical protein